VQICKMLNISRQAYYKRRDYRLKEELEETVVVQLVKEIRRRLPRLGGRKLYYMLEEDLQKFATRPGRDKFFEILRKNGLLIKPVKAYVVTTNSHHRFRIYTNLIKQLGIEQCNKVYVSDITYIRLREGFCYLFIVTDLYSRKIMGYALSKNLRVEGAIAAMNMAIRTVPLTEGLIHHSDRGFQYCSQEYVELLEGKGIKLSMGEAGNPYDNAVAERINGILKMELLLGSTFNDYDVALKATKEAVSAYNNLRPHMSLGYMTPAEKYAA
jgi:putative transposase